MLAKEVLWRYARTRCGWCGPTNSNSTAASQPASIVEHSHRNNAHLTYIDHNVCGVHKCAHFAPTHTRNSSENSNGKLCQTTCTQEHTHTDTSSSSSSAQYFYCTRISVVVARTKRHWTRKKCVGKLPLTMLAARCTKHRPTDQFSRASRVVLVRHAAYSNQCHSVSSLALSLSGRLCDTKCVPTNKSTCSAKRVAPPPHTQTHT